MSDMIDACTSTFAVTACAQSLERGHRAERWGRHEYNGGCSGHT